MTSYAWNDLTTVFILILMALSATTNLLLVVDILTSSRLRTTVFSVCVANLAVINVVHSVAIAAFSVAHLTGHPWLLNAVVCSWNCWLYSVLDTETIFAVTLMNVDRAVVALSPRLYNSRMSFFRVTVMLAATWIIGVTFFSPVVFNDFQTRFQPSSFSCVMYGVPAAFVSIRCIVCVCFPLVIMFFAVAIILLRIHQFRRRLKAIPRSKVRATNADLQDFYAQSKRGIYSLLVFFAFFVLHGPYLTFQLLSYFLKEDDITITYAQDIVMTWIKTVFLLVFPFLSFFLYADVRSELQKLLCMGDEGELLRRESRNVIFTTTASTVD